MNKREKRIEELLNDYAQEEMEMDLEEELNDLKINMVDEYFLCAFDDLCKDDISDLRNEAWEKKRKELEELSDKELEDLST